MISELLYHGAGNARTARELAAALNMDRRTVTVQIERERRNGKPICASVTGESRGYFLPASEEELQAYCSGLRKRAGEIFKTRRAMLRCLTQIQGEGAPDDVQ